jgi:hypothetical protein
MTNSNSLYNKFSRYVGGGITETSGDFLEWWERAEFEQDESDIVYPVENFYEGRLDLIASVFYNEPRLWWFIAQYNNILNPAEEITAGRILLIPTKSRIALMINSRHGGVQSTRAPVNTISQIIK